MSHAFSLATYAVVRDGRGRVLLTRRRESDAWVLPGGSVEDGEAPWEAVAREVKEETGLDVEVTRLVGLYAKREERDLVLVFEADSRTGELRTSDERDRVEFVDPRDLPEGTSERDRERIADALRDRPTVVHRVQPSEGSEPPGGTR